MQLHHQTSASRSRKQSRGIDIRNGKGLDEVTLVLSVTNYQRECKRFMAKTSIVWRRPSNEEMKSKFGDGRNGGLTGHCFPLSCQRSYS
jgi:hypothetical protein